MRIFYSFLFVIMMGCNPSVEPVPHRPDILVVVNGTAITEADLTHLLDNRGHGRERFGPEGRRAALELLVEQELLRQGAEDAGLDREEDYLATIGPLEAELQAAKRRLLGDRYLHDQTMRGVEVSDAAIAHYFEENKTKIATQWHIKQIARDSIAEIEEARHVIESGGAFDAVAALRFAAMPSNAQAPWDLGYLKWQQIPQAWWPHLDGLADGQVSPAISGAGSRHWLIQVVERRIDPAPKMDEATTSAIRTILRNEETTMRKDALLSDLRAGATITWTEATDSMPH